jgi:hypothetical protein
MTRRSGRSSAPARANSTVRQVDVGERHGNGSALLQEGKRLMPVGCGTQPLAVRLDAARLVAPYCHPRLSPVDIGSREDRPLQVQIIRFSDIDTSAR